MSAARATGGVRCHGDLCAAGQLPCPTPWACAIEPVAGPAGPRQFCNTSQTDDYVTPRWQVSSGGDAHLAVKSRGV